MAAVVTCSRNPNQLSEDPQGSMKTYLWKTGLENPAIAFENKTTASHGQRTKSNIKISVLIPSPTDPSSHGLLKLSTEVVKQ